MVTEWALRYDWLCWISGGDCGVDLFGAANYCDLIGYSGIGGRECVLMLVLDLGMVSVVLWF